jgi:uncharacterized protein (TIGR01777 family)
LKEFPQESVEVIEWDPVASPLNLQQHQPIDAVINLMGEPIASGRWTSDKKKRIVDSRVVGTERLVEAVSELEQKPGVVVSASAIGYYGDRGEQELTEIDPPGKGFLPETCLAWERAAEGFASAGIRLVQLRIGIVMSTQGGALAEMLPVFRTGVAGRLGSGQQYVSWIHIQDLVSLILWALENESARGVYNAVAPGAVTNAELTRQLAAVLNRMAAIPVPRFALRLSLGEFADTLFESQRVIPQAALADGFQFQFGNLGDCLQDLLN